MSPHYEEALTTELTGDHPPAPPSADPRREAAPVGAGLSSVPDMATARRTDRFRTEWAPEAECATGLDGWRIGLGQAAPSQYPHPWPVAHNPPT